MRFLRGDWGFLLLALELLTLIGVAGIAQHQIRNVDRVYPGVSVAGMSLAGLTLDQAAEELRSQLSTSPRPVIVLRDGERTWRLSPTDLGVDVNSVATAAVAYRLGRESLASGADAALSTLWHGLKADLWVQWTLLRDGATIEPLLDIDTHRLELVLRQLAAEIDVPPREAQLNVTDQGVSGKPGQIGRQLDVPATQSALFDLLQDGKGGTLDLVIRERRPALLAVDTAVAQTTTLLQRSYTLAVEGQEGEQQFVVEPADLRRWLTFTLRPTDDGRTQLAVQINEAQVAAFVQRIAAQMDRPALDAQLDWDAQAGQVIVLQPSQPGQRLDTAAAVATIAATLSTTIPQAEAAIANHAMNAASEIVLPVAPISPSVDSARIAEMGIVEQISEGTTYFKGSSPERIHNIALSAGKLRSAVVPPGEVFSFNAIVGDVSAENGFVDSLIIVWRPHRGGRRRWGLPGVHHGVSRGVLGSASPSPSASPTATGSVGTMSPAWMPRSTRRTLTFGFATTRRTTC